MATDDERDKPLDCNEGKVLKRGNSKKGNVRIKGEIKNSNTYLVVLNDGRFRDGNDNGGSVGTDNGGNPKIGLVWKKIVSIEIPVAVVVFCNPVLIGNVVLGTKKNT